MSSASRPAVRSFFSAIIAAACIAAPLAAPAQTASDTVTVVSSPSPAYVGQEVTFTASVASAKGTPTGTVSFYIGTILLGTLPVTSGTASISEPTTDVSVGTYPITADYSGDFSFQPSTGTASFTLLDEPTTTTINAPNILYIGQPLTLTATVSAAVGTPTGSVSFLYQNQTFASAPLVNGTATFSTSTAALSSGAYVVTAGYQGAGTFAPSTSAGIQISVGDASTITTLTSTNPVLTAPAALNLTATVVRTSGSGKPTGTVTFTFAGQPLATVALNSAGVATYNRSTAGIAVGQYTIGATYNGDSNDRTSGATGLNVTVAGTVDIAVTVNPLANRHVISPLIYGTNFPPSTAYVQNTNSTLARWAGDAATNYNWQTGITNLADDYFFANFPFNGSGAPQQPLYNSSQAYVSGVSSVGANPIITIGMLPWVAKDDTSYSYSVAKYGKQCLVNAYNSDEGNGIKANCATEVTTNDPNDAYFPLLDAPSDSDPPNSLYRSQWVAALVPDFGHSLHLYGVDNEPEIWGGVHWDVHPDPTTYDEMRTLFLTKIPNLKQWDTQATVLAPGSSGWYYYWNSGSVGADKSAHAGLDYNPWLLNEIYWNDLSTGVRTMDWYDLHAYPDGTETNYTQAQKQALALRVLRDFWDPSYQGEGADVNQQYVTSMQPNRTYAFRIPRMKALINSIYPGTPTTFSEWNAALAGETDFSTALVDVDAWGIFGRENLYAASRWTASAVTSPAYNSLLMYRNYDGANSTFGTTSIEASNSGNVDLFSSYAALNAAGSQMTIILVNKDPNNNNEVTLSLGSFTPTSLAEYSLGQSHPSGIVAVATPVVSDVVNIPPYSAMLLVMNGSLQKAPAVEWALSPDETMVAANGTITLSPKILSGTGTVTLSSPQMLLSNPANTAGISLTIPNPQITSTQPGMITVTANSTPGFYQFSLLGTDNTGVAQTQTGWILVQNPAAILTKSGDNQSGPAGSTIALNVILAPGQSGGSSNSANIFFTTSAGTLSAREVTTNAFGAASVILTLPATPGIVTVTAEGQYGLGHPVATFTATAQ